MKTAREVQSGNTTYGLATGFSGVRTGNAAARRGLKDGTERELELQNDLTTFYDAKSEGKVMQTAAAGILTAEQVIARPMPTQPGAPPWQALNGAQGSLVSLKGPSVVMQ